MITNADVTKLNARIRVAAEAEREKSISDVENRVSLLYQRNKNITAEIAQHQRAIRDLMRQKEQNANTIRTHEIMLEHWK